MTLPYEYLGPSFGGDTWYPLCSDGWSWGVLKAELAAAYNALHVGRVGPDLLPLPVQYADFAAWQRARLDGGALEAQARPCPVFKSHQARLCRLHLVSAWLWLQPGDRHARRAQNK